MTFDPSVPPVRVAGVKKNGVVLDIRTVVMPASYATDGHPVDLSAAFGTVHAVQVLRAFVTSTGLSDGRIYKPVQTGTDTYANRKFRVWAELPLSAHEHTYDKATAIGNVSGLAGGVTASAGNPPTLTAAATADTQADPDAGVGGPSVVLAGHTHVVNLDKIPQHQHSVTNTPTATTGGAGAAATEVAAATDLSTVTVEYLVIGVPA